MQIILSILQLLIDFEMIYYFPWKWGGGGGGDILHPNAPTVF